uniref:Uncharacterized protein n=1 Tax=Chlamydomonas euryale TaxID=1486919 RepID=A0A7R9YRJ3_9CHLO|mmetsp:Transcript_14336/g.41797  ORF Transcript_14336/g.41797 Transcript_14336/m.41797 type:complete len:188 (+) Transcript_14336:536-1099(+)
MPIAPGLVAYEEVKLDNVKVGTDFNQLAVLVHDGQPAGATNAASVVEHHGWRGSLGFQNACAQLSDIEVDPKEQEIYMTVPNMPGEVMLLVDWDAGNVDVKLGVFPHPGTNDKAYELTIRSAGGCNKRVMELYTPPRPKLGGRFQFGRIFELDDVPYGTAFKDMQIIRYQLSNPRSFNVQQVTRVMG